MTVVFLILRIIGILLLVLLALLVVVLVLPAGVEVRWRQGSEWKFWLTVGPYRHRFSLPQLPDITQPAKPEPPKREPAAHSGGRKAAAADSVHRKAEQKKEPAETPPASPKKLQPVPAENKAADPQSEIDQLYEKIMSDPVHYVKLFQHWARQTGGFLLRHLRVRKVQIVWTVTGENAATTAIEYGAVMAACNTAWSILKDFVDIRADNLRIDPDFTGEAAEKRCFACQITARMYIIVTSIYLTVRAAAGHRKKSTKR